MHFVVRVMQPCTVFVGKATGLEIFCTPPEFRVPEFFSLPTCSDTGASQHFRTWSEKSKNSIISDLERYVTLFIENFEFPKFLGLGGTWD